jgi:uncharacterized membrane protein YccF (DUF307 family)
MNIILNILWFILAGIGLGLSWYFAGLLWCITIVGIPVGVQCFKLGTLMFWPFGKEVVYSTSTSSVLLNILWLIFGGIAIAIEYLIAGVLLCITIIGIPLGLQCFKFMKLALMPFGARVVPKGPRPYYG